MANPSSYSYTAFLSSRKGSTLSEQYLITENPDELLKDACSLVCDAASAQYFQAILEGVGQLINHAMSYAYGPSQLFDFIPSFAHSDANRRSMEWTGSRTSNHGQVDEAPPTNQSLSLLLRKQFVCLCHCLLPLANSISLVRCEISSKTTTRPVGLPYSMAQAAGKTALPISNTSSPPCHRQPPLQLRTRHEIRPRRARTDEDRTHLRAR